MWRLTSLLLLAWCGLAWGAPPLSAATAGEATAARAALEHALGSLAAHPTARGLRAAERSIERLERVCDQYFHAPNLAEPTARPWALALRPIVHRLIRGDGAVFQLGEDDVLHVRAPTSDALATAAEALGRMDSAIIFRRRAKMARPTPARRAALKAALRRRSKGGG